MEMTGCILCIIDGVTDETSTIPHVLVPWHKGSFATTPTGFDPESMPCILSLMGLGPEQIPKQGRGWLEALGSGVAVHQDMLVLRVSWVKTDSDGKLAGVVAPPEQPDLPGYYSLGSYKGILCLPGLAKTLSVVQTFAPHRHMGRALSECMPRGLPVLPQPFASQGIWMVPWGESTEITLPRLQLPAVAVCGIPLVRGIAHAMGMESVQDKGLTGEVDTALAMKKELALCYANEGSFVLLHINGADEAAHRGDTLQKAAFIQKSIEDCVLPLLQSKVQVMVTSDHGTSCRTGRHMANLQPFYTNFYCSKGEAIMAHLAVSMFGSS